MTAALPTPLPLTRAPRRLRWSPTRLASYAFAGVAVAFLVGMVALFVVQSIPVWKHEGWNYLTGRRWYFRKDAYGTLWMLYGTAVVGGIALLLAAPIGIGAAVFTAEYLPRRARLAVKLTVELLAGIPSVVYGLLGILFLRTFVQARLAGLGFDVMSGDSLLTAGILLAVMVLPTIMTLADDALRAVPSAQRLAARGLGLSRTGAILSVALPQAKAGILAAVLLGFGRALGEAIAVFLVVGRKDWLTAPWTNDKIINAGQTLTSKLAGAETNIAYGAPLHWAAIVGLGLLLLLIVAAVTLVAAFLSRKRGPAHA